jgi:hypothetical protein
LSRGFQTVIEGCCGACGRGAACFTTAFFLGFGASLLGKLEDPTPSESDEVLFKVVFWLLLEPVELLSELLDFLESPLISFRISSTSLAFVKEIMDMTDVTKVRRNNVGVFMYLSFFRLILS